MSALTPQEPSSLSNHLPDVLLRRVEAIPAVYVEMTELDLSRLMPLQKFSVQDRRLRISFWQEFHRASAEMQKVSIDSICRGICNRRHFLEQVCANPIRLSFLLLPPADYHLALEESLDTLVSKMRDIADLPVTNESGDPIYKNIDAIMKAFSHIDNRVKGAAVQRIESKSVNVNATAVPSTVQDIDKRLQELETQAARGVALPAPQTARIGVVDVPIGGGSDGEEETS